MSFFLYFGIGLVLPAQVDSLSPNFLNEVAPILSLGGCNQGACHGGLHGKGGFKLSLRGEDPAYDYDALVKQAGGRRISNPIPSESLVVQKAIAKVPHEGGKRFKENSIPYTLLVNWIAQGSLPPKSWDPGITSIEIVPKEKLLVGEEKEFSIRVMALLKKGGVRDVTSLVAYDSSDFGLKPTLDGKVVCDEFMEGTLAARFLGKQAPIRVIRIPQETKSLPPFQGENFIDKAVYQKLAQIRIPPKGVCSDSIFLRRAFLDLNGQLPTPQEARAFLADKTPAKREKLVDQLLDRAEFSQLWAMKWSDLLRNEEKTLDAKGVRLFYDWIRRSFQDDKPLDQFALELLSARGSTYSQPAGNYYRGLRDPETRAEAFAQVFLGLRIQCARCHNHPFDRWTQEDYHRLASFFSRIQYQVLENNRRDILDKHEFAGEQIVWLSRSGMTLDPRTRQPLLPRFPGGGETLSGQTPDWLLELGKWVGKKDNPFFAPAQANRVWFHLMGRGIVEPLEDFRSTNLPINPPLLNALAEYFTQKGYRLKPLVKAIVLSQTYQASASAPGDPDDFGNFAQAKVRSLKAEELLDGLSRVLDFPARFPGYPEAERAIAVPGTGLRYSAATRGADSSMAKFLQSFGKPSRSLTCECERSEETTLGQAFHMISGPVIHEMLSAPGNRIGKLLTSGASDEKILKEFFLTALCRYPSVQEENQVAVIIKRSADRRHGWEDVVWGIVNSKEFLLRQ